MPYPKHPNRMMYSVPAPVRDLTRSWMTWEMPRGNNTIYLTFDDGPDPKVTPLVLEILKSHQARATFFLSGRKAEAFPDLVTEIRSQGHSLGNHGYDHLRGWATPVGKYLDNVSRCASVVESGLFRPPFGSIGPIQLLRIRRLGYRICMWSVISRDYDQAVSREACLARCLKHIRDGSVVLFHDTPRASRNCLWVLPRVLAHFQGRGFRFTSWEQV